MTNDLRIRFLDVGQGDAIVGILPGGRRAFVVDVCNCDRVLDFLEEEQVSEVILFLTHSDRDHTSGAKDLLVALDNDQSQIQLMAIYFSRDRIVATQGSEFANLVRFIGRHGRRLSRLEPRFRNADFNTVLNDIPGFQQLFEPVRLLVVHPDKADQDSLIGNTNDTAGVILVEHAASNGVFRRVLLTADIALAGISLILERIKNTPVLADVLKYPHHGAWPLKHSKIDDLEISPRSMADFLYTVSPTHVVFSVGSQNPYGHIRPEVFDLLMKFQTECKHLQRVAWTERTGTCDAAKELPVVETPDMVDIEVSIGNGFEGVLMETFELNALNSSD